MENSFEGQPGPSDEMLAELERSIEDNVDVFDSSRNGKLQCDAASIEGHKRLFQIVDNMTAPVRTALCSTESPPVLEDYDELVEIGRGGMGVVYRLWQSTSRKMLSICDFCLPKYRRSARSVEISHVFLHLS